MIQEIISKIKDKKIILFGEIHGTKEIPELLSTFFNDIAKDEDFNLCLEIPDEFQKQLDSYMNSGDYNALKSILFFSKDYCLDGRNSLEYVNLIKTIYDINSEYNRNIKIFCIDPLANSQEEKENGMADKILKLPKNKKLFVIFGNVHASKIPIKFQDINITTTGTILHKKLNEEVFSINFIPKKGSFYNFGIKEINSDDGNDSFNKGFDYVVRLASTKPCSFLH